MSLKNPTDEELQLQGRFIYLCHAMQTGVKYDQESGSKDGSPKHLRTGVNVSLNQHGALALLLERKGIINSTEYWEALIQNMESEVLKYEKLLGEKLGTNIKLG